MVTPLTCIDLFAGCGGLSLGLKQAGYEIKLAVEKSPMAGETYYHNFIHPVSEAKEWCQFHEDLSIEEQARSGLVVRELSDVLNSQQIISELKLAEIDLVAGGPPCQGFSIAGRRNPRDDRNELPWQFLEFVGAVRPKAVIIENVSGIQQNFRKHQVSSPFNELRMALAKTNPGYVVQPMLLNAMHFGVPQNRPRVFLVAVMKSLAIDLGMNITSNTWDSTCDSPHQIENNSNPTLAPRRTHFNVNGKPRHLTVGEAIPDLLDSGYKPGEPSTEFAREMRFDTAFLKTVKSIVARTDCPANHVLRRHSDHVVMRFQLYHYLRQQGVNSRVLAIPTKSDIPENTRCMLINEAFAKVTYPASLDNGLVLAKNKREMVSLINKLATKKHSQGALSLHEPAPTVMALPAVRQPTCPPPSTNLAVSSSRSEGRSPNEGWSWLRNPEQGLFFEVLVAETR